ncbi:CoA transferase, partial [Klebsiella pneumoniae]|uniref:CoA transferase n=1 Tax=Klebsiella pneumoniae TaxID=573 RepID=UPI001953804C
TTDGWITASANTGSEWQGLCAALNRPEWLSDQRYLTPGARILNGALLFQAMQDDFVQNTSSHWLALLDA